MASGLGSAHADAAEQNITMRKCDARKLQLRLAHNLGKRSGQWCLGGRGKHRNSRERYARDARDTNVNARALEGEEGLVFGVVYILDECLSGHPSYIPAFVCVVVQCKLPEFLHTSLNTKSLSRSLTGNVSTIILHVVFFGRRTIPE